MQRCLASFFSIVDFSINNFLTTSIHLFMWDFCWSIVFCWAWICNFNSSLAWKKKEEKKTIIDFHIRINLSLLVNELTDWFFIRKFTVTILSLIKTFQSNKPKLSTLVRIVSKKIRMVIRNWNRWNGSGK